MVLTNHIVRIISSGSDTAPTGGSSDDNGALSNVASMGVVGILGAIAAAFLA